MGSLCRRLAFFVLALSAPSRLVAQEAPIAPPPAVPTATTDPAPSPPPEAPPAATPTERPAPAPPPPSTPVHGPSPTPGHAVPERAPPARRSETRPAPARPTRAPDRRRADTHVDRVMVLPTAETQPAGTLILSSYDIALLQLGYAVSDTTQVTFTTTPPFGEAVPLDLAIKSALSRGPWYRLALLGAVSGVALAEEESVFLGRAGFVGQVCLERACGSSVNLGATAVLAGAVLVGSGTGLVLGFAPRWALVAELDLLLPTSRRVARAHGALGGAGVRWTGPRWALDVGALARLDESGPPLPLAVFSYRFPRDP